MKIWVDDTRDAPDDSWTVVRKVEPAIALLAKFPMTHISLDHDIENRPDDETFKPVAYFIGEKYWTHKQMDREFEKSEFSTKDMAIARLSLYPEVTIHSINSVAAKEMATILNDYGIIAKIKPYEANKTT